MERPEFFPKIRIFSLPGLRVDFYQNLVDSGLTGGDSDRQRIWAFQFPCTYAIRDKFLTPPTSEPHSLYKSRDQPHHLVATKLGWQSRDEGTTPSSPVLLANTEDLSSTRAGMSHQTGLIFLTPWVIQSDRPAVDRSFLS